MLGRLDRLENTGGLEDRLIKDVCKLLEELGHEGMAGRLEELVERMDGEITYLEDSLETRDSDVEALKEEIYELREELREELERIGELENELAALAGVRDEREG